MKTLMKTIQVDVLLYDAESPAEMRVGVRIPVSESMAQHLLEAQQSGKTTYAQTALYNLAAAVGYLNGTRGIPLRVREVEQ